LNEEKVKVRFVKNLKFCAGAMCLYWIDEIHADESFKDSPALDDIIRHEMKHYEIVQKIFSSKSWKKPLLFFYNNLWDTFSCCKIHFKYFRQFKVECLWDLVYLTFIALAVLFSFKVI